ncbi:enoyl-CoA-hydratase DpgB [Streptomyces hoynatensis]|uniref:Enoyl-CoA hydratase/isomerase family protein n=1 Tax=Streptomyces hoynatensis TaxID=1141874 RepID=A0A3A9YZN5_9ACTN|nr:enoyl-CoA-hydratase DpgB [Streptomyces hoynatensis]RKN41209.1 enoyl-CoA hydratase/isomerase family protein [Streptomyces hoynatensis]
MSTSKAEPQEGAGADVELVIDSAGPLSQELITGLNELCERVEDAPDEVLVVLRLRASGAAGGQDPAQGPRSWPGEGVGIHLVNRWERALRRLERLGAATVAVAEGPCGGPALETLLATDYRLGTPGTTIELPASSGEFWPGMAVHRLANQLGVVRARRLVLFGAGLTAAESVQAGLLDEIVTDVAEGIRAARELTARVTGSELALRRRLLLEAATTSFEEALGAHLAACDRTLRRGQREAGTVPAVAP